MRTLIAALFAAFLGLQIGLMAALEWEEPGQWYRSFKYSVRTSLGLEKDWAKVAESKQAKGRKERSCPSTREALVLVVAGQSNAANMVSSRHRSEGDVAVWFDGKCFDASDPLLGGGGTWGSLWSMLSDRLEEDLDRPILLIAGAVGGSQFGDWLDPRSGYYDALMHRVSAARGAGYEADMILWHQGETDAAAEHDLEKLKADIAHMTDLLLRDMPDALLYLFQATRCTGAYRLQGVPQVVEVMQQVAADNPRIITGMNTDVLGRDFRWDRCHFNSSGRDAIVTEITPEIAARLRQVQ